jgi:6,7-dimethyl-8-ribityllumazine synthase
MNEPVRSGLYQGGDNATGFAFAIVVSRYNQYITERLLNGAQSVLKARGAARVDLAWVPGALEIPVVAKQLAQSGHYHAIICLGCVIKGETLHFDLVAREAAAGVAQVALETGIPVINEILAVFDPAHAAARAGGHSNRGEEAAHTAIYMASLMRTLPHRFVESPPRA